MSGKPKLFQYSVLCGIFHLLLVMSSFSQSVQEFQSISTHGATGLKSFIINDTAYLAIANYQNDVSYEINSQVFRWNGNKFILFQEIPTSGGVNPDFFEIDGKKFLAFGNYVNNKNDHTIKSVIYQWDGNKFQPFQEIPTIGAYRWKLLKTGVLHLLVIANQCDSSVKNMSPVNSEVLKWNGSKFAHLQYISTTNATDLTEFTIGDTLFLGIACTFGWSCPLYKWDGKQFTFSRTVQSSWATGIQAFTIHNQLYLNVANGSEVMISLPPKIIYSTKSTIYKWNGNDFVPFQSIPTIGAFNLKIFEGKDTYFMAAANYKDGNNYLLDSPLYKWNGTDFSLLKNIATAGATQW
jgi:hypothetical protein